MFPGPRILVLARFTNTLLENRRLSASARSFVSLCLEKERTKLAEERRQRRLRPSKSLGFLEEITRWQRSGSEALLFDPPDEAPPVF